MAAVEQFPIGRGATLRELQEDPHPLLARLRTAEPVSWLAVRGGWLVTRYDLALQVLRDPTTFTVDDPRFSTSRVVGASMLSLDGVDHTRHREPFAHPFRPTRVRERFAEFIQAEADRMITAIQPTGSAELRREFAGPLSVAVVTEALGLRDVDVDTVLSWYAAIVAAVSEVTAGRPVTAAGTDAFARLRAAVQRTLSGTDEPSLLSEAAHAPEGLSQDEVASNAAVLMFGGIDTTEGMILNAVRHLLDDPATLALVRDHADLLPNAIEESIRLEPAAAIVDRYATRDVELGGGRIQRGDLV
ncbi:MAG TPA: cytochrome P450, partial [Mycobacterium sp.]|nr:cytochrome P450 [Mycobacterium sp.]